jgi:LCP family protein required for cell wall assembly
MIGDERIPSQNEATGHKSRRHRIRKAKLTLGQKTRRSALVILVVIVLLAGGVVYYGFNLYGRIKKLNVSNLSTNTNSLQPINILLVGSNSRAALNGKQAKYFGSASQVGGARSDVTMIAHLDPKTLKVTLLSIPRDLFVPIPNSKSSNRVDDALNVSPSQLVKTVEQDLGIPIQHFVELNFDTFQQVVQALGGIKMYFPMPVKDAYSGLNITTTGCLQLNGFQALEVVRARHLYYQQNGVWIEDPLGDLSRIRRDHEFLKVLATQVKQKGISNPFTLNSIVSAMVPYLQVDSSFTISDMLSLASKFRHINPSAISSLTLPVELVNNYVYKGANYGDVVFPTEPQDSQVISSFLNGQGTQPSKSNKAPVAVLNGSGIANQAATVANTLKADGYKIAEIGNTPVLSTPSETIIRYEPGFLSEALALKSTMSGSIIMGQAPTVSGAKVEIITGSQLTVYNSSTSTVSGQSPSTTSASAATTQAASTATTMPITVASTTAKNPLKPWDPRACPA